MAKKKIKKTKTEVSSQENSLLDMTNRAVKKMIKAAKAEGFVNYKELNKVITAEKYTSEQIEDVMSLLSEMGISVVENEDQDENQSDEKVEVEKPVKTTSSDRTDDPVRMYLREMGSVDLLSREGEIAIAKRIEAGKEAMIEGLCESPLTFQAIIIWRDELNEGQVLLRDIIDLEASYIGPDAKNKKIAKSEKDENSSANEESSEDDNSSDSDSDYNEYENNVSLAAMEADLKPEVFLIFDEISVKYKKLRTLQDKRNLLRAKNSDLSTSQIKKYDEFTRELKNLPEKNKVKIIEALWSIIYSNKDADMYETNLMRRLAGLLYISSKTMGDIKDRIKKENQ